MRGSDRRTSRALGALAALATAAVCVAAAHPAAALQLVVDPTQSLVTIGLAASFDGSEVPLATVPSPITAQWSGTVDVATSEAGGAVTSLQILGGTLSLSNLVFQVASAPVLQAVVQTSGVGASGLSTGVLTAGSVNGGSSTFDVGGAQGLFDQGSLTAQGLAFNAPVNVDANFAQSPLVFALDPGTIATASLVPNLLTLTIPLSTSALLPLTGLPPGVQVIQTFSGQIVMTVPEPASFALVAVGVLALATRRRRAA